MAQNPVALLPQWYHYRFLDHVMTCPNFDRNGRYICPEYLVNLFV